MSIPDERSITSGETALLRSVFQDTLPYGILRVRANTGNLGGADNSITPGNTPFLSTQIWCADFSDTTVSKGDRGIFIHEFVHVWQYYHGITKLSVILLIIRHPLHYENTYPYDLSDYGDLTDFNVEQQAAIIEDWWRITQSLLPLNNTGADKTLTAYSHYVDQLRSAGPPHTPAIPPIPRHWRV